MHKLTLCVSILSILLRAYRNSKLEIKGYTFHSIMVYHDLFYTVVGMKQTFFYLVYMFIVS